MTYGSILFWTTFFNTVPFYIYTMIKKWNEFCRMFESGEYMDDYLDTLNGGGHIYWDEKEKLFIGKSMDLPRVRNLDGFQKRLVEHFPDIIMFIYGDSVLIPTYIDGDMISGVGYAEKDGSITFQEFCNQWQSFVTDRDVLDSHDELFTSIAEEITENDGNPYIEQNKENDEIDRSRIDRILAYLGKMSNAEFSEFTRANIPDKRYWDWNRSKFDVAQYIIDNDLWEKFKGEIG